MKKLCLIFVFLLSVLFAKSQTSIKNHDMLGYGTVDIKGKVVDAKTGEPVIGANVVIKGSTKGATTDINGDFILNSLKNGDLTLTISYVSYKPYENTFLISNESKLNLNIKLEESIAQIQTVNVVSQQITNTDLSMMQTIRQGNLVANGVASQLIKKTQDRDAGEVVKRIPGITMQNERFVIIRGLNERYNSVWLNDLPAPSAETDVRAFSFDFISASMIDNVVVYKTFSPELSSDFAGGLIQISTVSNPEKNFFQISFSNGYTTISTFQNHKLYDVKGKGFMANNSELMLPSNFPAQFATISNNTQGKQEKTKWGQALNKTWSPASIKAPTDQSFSLSNAWKKNFKKSILSNCLQVNYSTSFNQRDIFRASYNDFDKIEQKPDTSYVFNDVQYNNSNKFGYMMNWCYSFGKNKIEFRNIFNNQINNKVVERSGKDFYGGIDLEGLEMALKTRRLYSGQLSGNHTFGKKNYKAKWYFGYSASSENSPDVKRLTWSRNEQEDSQYYNKYGLNFSFTANSNLSGRIFHTMNEKVISAGSDFKSNIKISNNKFDYSFGIFYESRERFFSARNLGYKMARASQFDYNIPYMSVDNVFTDKNINTTNGIMLDEQTLPSDSYTSSTNLTAGFFTVTLPVGSRIKIHTGLRAENNKIELNSYKTDASVILKESDKVKYLNDTLLFLPAFNLTYSITEKSLVRFAYGKTINRPEYREIAPMAFYDYEMKSVISGNDSLTFATINNFDLRYELYPNTYSIFSVGTFYKQFKNAIEYKVIPTGSGLQYTYQNTVSAIVAGIEAEMRLSTAPIDGNSFIKNFVLIINSALIYSKINFEENSLEESRALQGQSPYIINAALFYQSDKLGLNAGLMYNNAGKRISFVGDPYTGNPSIYELSSNQLDFSFAKQFAKNFEVKAQIKNILNNSTTYQQTVKTAKVDVKQTTMQYKSVQYFTLGITWKI